VCFTSYENIKFTKLFAIREKEGVLGVTGLELIGILTDGVTGLDAEGEIFTSRLPIM